MSQVDRVLTLFKERDFRVLLGSQYLAQAADGFAQVALANELILETSDTPGRLLSVVALTLLPYSLIAPFMGVFVDRWPRRGLLVWTNVARGALLASIPLWWAPGQGDTALYAGALVLLGLGRLFLVTKGAALPVVLHDHHLLRGNAVSGGGGMIAALGGGLVGVVATGATGTEGSLVIAGVLYVVAAVIARALSVPMSHPGQRAERLLDAIVRVAGELSEGLKQVWRRAEVRLPMTGILVLRTAGMMTAFAAIFVIKTQYPDAVDRTGRLTVSALALAAAGIGAFLGAISTPALGRRFDKPRLILLGFSVSGVGIVALGGIDSLVAVLLLTVSGGFGTFTAKIAVDAQVQEVMPDEFRGRAFALYDILYNVASVFAALILVVSEELSLRIVLMGAGALCLLAAGGLSRAMKRAGVLKPTTGGRT